ncbi:YceD family protein [Leptolyngbya sp. CCNP1308]|uniref:YceD family protein n=1 Tax=Leptolyngbya sp. CCNP1308 TaxID=3110255 RepID=UPI002B1F5E53|nr:YceD family protein [Leptolyngbya sp. CCNP1308]MEA5448195.1 YceD family protein [Leptolyngbya sp. CCNP1308]
MEKVYIPQLLQRPEQTLTVDLNSHLADLDTLTPVRGELTVTHQGTYLEVKARADTIVTLTCDRCLQAYNHRVSLSAQELIWLEHEPDPATLPLEREVSVEDLFETLPPNGYFYPETWLYEQICLALPMPQICDEDCSGIELRGQGAIAAQPTDHRWAALTQLQQQLEPPDA